MLIGCENFVV